MSATRNPETIVTAWLDEGPTDLPDVTRRAILTALPTTQQRRLGPLASLRLSMMIYPRFTAAVLVTVIAVGGSMYLLGQRNPVGAPASTAPPAAPTPTPSAVAAASAVPPINTGGWVPFTSAFYGFTVSSPVTWTERPASGHWAFATRDEADEDVLWSPGGWPEFTGFETRIPKSTTPDAFIEALTADAVAVACYPAKDLWVQTTVDGHAATIAYAGCNEHFFFAEALVPIGDRIWVFDLFGPDRSLIVPFLSTVRIDPAAVVD